ncbi:hypothetical protein L596_013603 [Steinernema carpocapsae]|uniref:Uncharacterized protein n=1 Tax=Steinernema carpocapsae TaxID=34508 RepID=A0A4U5P148_STECR|nr:hypothetical protein L596_013603 [Steinernema carpocapsae]
MATSAGHSPRVVDIVAVRASFATATLISPQIDCAHSRACFLSTRSEATNAGCGSCGLIKGRRWAKAVPNGHETRHELVAFPFLRSFFTCVVVARPGIFAIRGSGEKRRVDNTHILVLLGLIKSIPRRLRLQVSKI